MIQLVEGVVTKYGKKWRQKDRFGYVAVEGHGELRFRFVDGLAFVERGDAVAWLNARVTRDPEIGTKLKLTIDTTSGRACAKPWGFAEDYDKIKQRIDMRLAA